VRSYPTSEPDPELNFPPTENFRTRSVNRYRTEPTAIDAIMYRITDRAHADEMIAAVKRGVVVRLITEPKQYRDPVRLWHAWNVDRMYMAGVKVRHRGHKGLSHEKLTILVGQHVTIFGSSNWTEASADSQYEHNLFTLGDGWFDYGRTHFDRKWNNLAPARESTAFVPQPGDVATLKVPANGATGVGTTVTFKWWAGPWNHKYDLYLGTTPTTMTKVLSARELGPSTSPTDLKNWTKSGLVEGQTYYWKVVSRTMANKTTTSATFSFTASTGAPPPPPPPLPAGWSNADIGIPSVAGSAGYNNGTFTVKGSGADIWNNADEFHYAWRTLSGSGTITARLSTLTKPSTRTKAGLMIRESTAAGSKHAAVVVNPSKGVQFIRRITTDGVTTDTAVGTGSTPKWLRLTRSGSTFRAYWSADAVTWKLVGSQTISMASTVRIGLAVTSHLDGAVATATFTDVTTP
jgi:regulation of enolase protein 1 (concanavalin A-like superfamily)